MAAECISLAAANDFAAKDTNRIQGKIGEVLTKSTPFTNILKGGTFGLDSDVVRSVVQEQAVLATSLAAPVFVNDTETCGTGGSSDQVGSTEYTYRLGTLRGQGPRVCVKTSRTAFKDSYRRAQESLQKGIVKITNSDIRHTLYKRSGVKMVAAKGYGFDELITGDAQQVDVQFKDALPTGAMTFAALRKLGGFLREDLSVAPYESDKGTMYRVIGSDDSIEAFRNELGVKEDLNYLASGSYNLGGKSLQGYHFEGPYRGFSFGVDPQPLRCTGFDEDGDLALVEPEIAVSVTNGVASRTNPAWVAAPYEVIFVVGADSFERLAPERYVGEGTFKFAPQMYSGELEWFAQRDWDCNLYGDFGQHLYQITRAYRPVRPHAIVPVLVKRCNTDLGFSDCDFSYGGVGL